MDLSKLIPGNDFTTFKPINVCLYDANDCIMPNGIPLPTGTELTYIGPDPDGGFIFMTDEFVKVCLHEDDLLYVTFAA